MSEKKLKNRFKGDFKKTSISLCGCTWFTKPNLECKVLTYFEKFHRQTYLFDHLKITEIIKSDSFKATLAQCLT